MGDNLPTVRAEFGRDACDRFMRLTENGLAVFRSAQCPAKPGSLLPPDGPGTYRLDERSCALRVGRLVSLAREDSPKHEPSLEETLLALRAIQSFKRGRGIALEMPELGASSLASFVMSGKGVQPR